MQISFIIAAGLLSLTAIAAFVVLRPVLANEGRGRSRMSVDAWALSARNVPPRKAPASSAAHQRPERQAHHRAQVQALRRNTDGDHPENRDDQGPGGDVHG
jgi:hypothetical protein